MKYLEHILLTLLMLLMISPLSAQPMGLEKAAEESKLKVAADALTNTYNAINWRNGINEEEARELAGTYSVNMIMGCGGPGTMTELDKAWKFETLLGFAAQPGPDIMIDKATGKITCRDHHDVLPQMKDESLVIVMIAPELGVEVPATQPADKATATQPATDTMIPEIHPRAESDQRSGSFKEASGLDDETSQDD